jgi:hypothetical protein
MSTHVTFGIEMDCKLRHMLFTEHFCKSSTADMGPVRNFEIISYRFKVGRICTSYRVGTGGDIRGAKVVGE